MNTTRTSKGHTADGWPDDSYAHGDHSHLTYDWNGHADMKMCGASLSDFEVAVKVRMLFRTQFDHEAVCLMARDRIMALSKEVARLDAALRKASEG